MNGKISFRSRKDTDKLLFIAQILGDIVGQGLAPAVKVCAIFCGTSKPVPYVKTLYLCDFLKIVQTIHRC